jgi:hypothetical protein
VTAGASRPPATTRSPATRSVPAVATSGPTGPRAGAREDGEFSFETG